jgi:hypothetical protein
MEYAFRTPQERLERFPQGGLGTRRAFSPASGSWAAPLSSAVIFKSGFDVKGIKAAAVSITGAIGLAVATSYWWLGIIVGILTVVILFIADSLPDPVREQPGTRDDRPCRKTLIRAASSNSRHHFLRTPAFLGCPPLPDFRRRVMFQTQETAKNNLRGGSVHGLRRL